MIELRVSDPFGVARAPIANYSKLEYKRAEGQVGILILDLDPNTPILGGLKLDYRLEPWRTAGNGAPYLDGDSPFYLRSIGRKTNADGSQVMTLVAYDANYLLKGANVAYFKGDAEATKTATAADDVMKAIVRENRGSLADDTARSFATYMTVQADLTAAPVTTKEISRRPVLDILNELAAESLKGGTYLTFDTVRVDATTLEFRTYTGQRGVNHGSTGSQRVTLREGQNLQEVEIVEDHTEEITVVYAGGTGTGDKVTVKTATNTAALGLSPFNRREKWITVNSSDGDTIQSAANAELSACRARKTFAGKLKDIDGCQEGVHFQFGDLLYVEDNDGQGYDAHYNSLHVTIEGGLETRDSQIRAEV
jgi:hypothetical protein